MYVIVEGPDGAGKTTLIETIRQRISKYFWILRPSHPPRIKYEIDTLLRTLEARYSSAVGFLLDRHPLISEPIYGPILRGTDILEIGGDYAISNSLLQRHVKHTDHSGHLIIYCRPPLSTIIENVRRNAPQQLGGVVDNTPKLVSEYDRMILSLEGYLPIVTYDYTKPNDLDALFERLEYHIR